MAFSRQDCWSGLPCPSLGDLPDPGIKVHILCLLHWQAGSLPPVPSEKLSTAGGTAKKKKRSSWRLDNSSCLGSCKGWVRCLHMELPFSSFSMETSLVSLSEENKTASWINWNDAAENINFHRQLFLPNSLLLSFGGYKGNFPLFFPVHTFLFVFVCR